uniref:Uncharacterized protein n=1 Tax=viral metagenome TaxID=1070528 RepID=A0A6C0EQY9_9ZZZZ
MDVNLLQKRILSLPQVIQDLIYEYNVEHRKQIKQLQDEYFRIIYKNCLICNSSISKGCFWSVDYFIYKTYRVNCLWCSEICLNKEKNEVLKHNYLTSVDNYLYNNTIQLPRQHLEI